MKPTPKLDEIVARLKYAANIFAFIPVYINRMNAGDFEGVSYAMEVLDGIKTAWEKVGENTITPKDVENELLGVCQDVTDTPKAIVVIGTKFNQIGLPVDIGSYADMTNENVQQLNDINHVPNDIKGGITLYLHMWGDYCQMWVMAAKNIINNLSEYAQNYQKVIAGNVASQEPRQVQVTTDTQSLPPEPQQMELKELLPEKLKVCESVRVFQRAIDAQLITYSPEGLKWNDTKQLLAYFATKVSEKFSLTTKLDKDGNITTAWKPFETLFKEQDLKGAKQNWMRLNTKFEPTGFEKVDALF